VTAADWNDAVDSVSFAADVLYTWRHDGPDHRYPKISADGRTAAHSAVGKTDVRGDRRRLSPGAWCTADLPE
jgi:hypothetical protein